ncbi:MAG: L,D-transpeptidase [Longimicrobiales bacterium]
MRFRRKRRKWLVLGAIVLGIGGVLIAGRSRLLQDRGVHLVLNVPENRLYVYEDGERVGKYRVSVGMKGYETPPGTYRVTHAIWNPWWHPPSSAWARGRKVEPPGPGNPMGRVKMYFGNMLYIHGTPEDQWLGRAASRGCVRMDNEDVVELARFLHSRATSLGSGQIDEIVGSSGTRRVGFKKPITFDVVYNVANVRNGFLFIYPDLYDRVDAFEEQVIRALRGNGISLVDVDPAKLERLIRKGRRNKVSMSIDTLTARPAPEPATVDGGG